MEYINNIIEKITVIFIVVGIFIPGFTAIGLLGLQMLIRLTGVECANSWKILWVITSIGTLLLPVFFRWFIIRNHKKLARYENRLKFKYGIIIFNLLELSCIQLTLGLFFTTGETLCYVADGQNGMELVFAAYR